MDSNRQWRPERLSPSHQNTQYTFKKTSSRCRRLGRVAAQPVSQTLQHLPVTHLWIPPPDVRYIQTAIYQNSSPSTDKGCHLNKNQKLRTFDLIREAVLPEYRDRVNEYLSLYEETLHSANTPTADIQASAQQLRGYLRGLNTTRVLGMADWEELDRRITESWL